MTGVPTPGSRLIVLGVDPQGAEVTRLPLGHGDDPRELLRRHGWRVRSVRGAVRHPAVRHLITVTFVVEPSVAEPRTVALRTSELEAGQPRRDDDLVILEGEVARQHQRVAAYAVVTSSRGFLMTEFSDQTNAPGQWGLPGGGLDADEAPDRAVLREVWEESGQLVEVGELALVSTGHWLGRSPTGQLEDFHAVRLIYRALCPEPSDPVVHDVGGTTASAAWLLPADLGLLALTPGWRSILRELADQEAGGAGRSGLVVTAPPDESDRSDHHQHDTQADDRARPRP